MDRKDFFKKTFGGILGAVSTFFISSDANPKPISGITDSKSITLSAVAQDSVPNQYESIISMNGSIECESGIECHIKDNVLTIRTSKHAFDNYGVISLESTASDLNIFSNPEVYMKENRMLLKNLPVDIDTIIVEGDFILNDIV